MSNLKTSLLVAQQVPEYVSDEYPLFVSFLEAYYEFMETAQGTQKNNVLSLGKNMRYISDVDVSIGAFEKSFFNNFASLIPRDVEINKETLIKNVLPPRRPASITRNLVSQSAISCCLALNGITHH